MNELTVRPEFIDDKLCRRFESAWSSGTPVSIESLLPDFYKQINQSTLQELVLIELEFIWSSTTADPQIPQNPQRLESYLKRFPSLRHPQTIARMIRQECLMRIENQQTISWQQYADRFPELNLSDHRLETLIANNSDTWFEIENASREFSAKAQLKLPCRFGDYELLEEIGRGGMGVVYRAVCRSSNRIVALKTMLPNPLAELNLACHDDAKQRFCREAKAISLLDHPNIVPVHDAGSVEDQHFLAMPYVPGLTLEEVLRDGPLSGAVAARILLAIAEAISAAHTQGILHCDIKPGNILIARSSGQPMLFDFGLAKFVDDPNGDSMPTGAIGSRGYMSPEHYAGALELTELSDVYSLGATLYSTLTGQIFPRECDLDVDAGLAAIHMKCLRKEPDERFQSASALAQALRGNSGNAG